MADKDKNLLERLRALSTPDNRFFGMQVAEIAERSWERQHQEHLTPFALPAFIVTKVGEGVTNGRRVFTCTTEGPRMELTAAALEFPKDLHWLFRYAFQVQPEH